MKRTNQGGSILGFVVIGAVMAVLLVGGAYIVRHSLTPPDADRTSVAQKDNDSATSDDKKNDASSDASKDAAKDSSSDTGKDAATTTPSQPETTLPSGTTPTDTHTLPTTGPTGGIVSGLLISSLVAVGVMYARSRQALRSL